MSSVSFVSGSEQPVPTGDSLRVLAVEDDPELREHLTLELEGAGLIAGRSTAVTVAPDLQHALEALEEGGVDLEQVLQDGAQDFLVKGTFSGAALHRLLRFVLARHRHNLELFTSMARSGDHDDLTRLESLGAAGVGVASRSLGRVTLAETCPEAVASAQVEYSQPIHSRLGERGLLGHLRATPRDVVDLHLAAVRALTQGTGRPRARALLRSGEGLLTETLGHLAAFYRAQALGRPSGRGWPAPVEAREDPS